MRKISGDTMDFVSSHIRCQIKRLDDILQSCCEGEGTGKDFILSSLVEIERDLKKLRKKLAE